MAKKDRFAEQFKASYKLAMTSEDQERLGRLKLAGHEGLGVEHQGAPESVLLSRQEHLGAPVLESQSAPEVASKNGAPEKEHPKRGAISGVPEKEHQNRSTALGVPEVHQLPIDRLERWRRIYLSDKPEEMDTWPNLADIGLTEEMLLEDIDIRELKGVPALLFDEDMAILDYNFGQPEWVKTKIKSSPLRYLRACIAQGGVTPAEGYESPVTARLKALQARRLAMELELKALERKR
jgi:hypothetical protein